MDLNKIIKNNFNKEKRELNYLISSINLDKIGNFKLLVRMSIKAIIKGNKILFYGNGGSAADSQHLATELTIRYKKKRKAIAALALTTDTSALTAAGNDMGFKKIFSRQIESLGNPGDIAIALTTSGNSLNLAEAAREANKKKIITFCFSGNKGGVLKKFTKYPIIINSKNASIIQTCEIYLGQIFCSILEDYFYKKK